MRTLGFALVGALIGAVIAYAAARAVVKRERRRP